MPPTANNRVTAEFLEAVSHYENLYVTNANFVVALNEVIIFQHKKGYANLSNNLAFDNDMVFPIASICKQFTAVAILLLQQENKLQLHNPIIDYLPASHPVWQNKAPLWAKQVTVHHLLTHTSGIQSYTGITLPDISSVKDEDVIPFIISFVKDVPLHFEPGEKFEYVNTGYLLLTVIIESVSQEKYAEYFSNRLFKPLKMINTFMPTIAQEKAYISSINQDEKGLIRYIANLEKVQSLPVPMSDIHLEEPLAGAGAAFSTLNDLLTWNRALYNGKILSQESLDLMTHVHITGEDPKFGSVKYGYGLFVKKDPNNLIYSHGGWLQGIRTELHYAPKSKTTVICLSNLSPSEQQDKMVIYRQFRAFSNLARNLLHIAMKAFH